MVATATNNRPVTQPASNTRMAKPDKDKSAKKSAKRGEPKPTGVLESSTELRNTVAAIEK